MTGWWKNAVDFLGVTLPWRTRDPHQRRRKRKTGHADNEIGQVNRIVKRRARKGRLSRKWARVYRRIHAGAAA